MQFNLKRLKEALHYKRSKNQIKESFKVRRRPKGKKTKCLGLKISNQISDRKQHICGQNHSTFSTDD